MNRRDILLALGRSGELTPERSDYVRRYPEDLVKLKLLEWKVPEAVLTAAEMPVTKFSLRPNRRLKPSEVQTAVDTHLALLGLDPVPVEYVHPNIADRWDLHPDWEARLQGAKAEWLLSLYHRRVARVLEFSTQTAFRPLLPLIAAGIHPYGLDASGERFLCVDTHADHDAGIREWDLANLPTERNIRP